MFKLQNVKCAHLLIWIGLLKSLKITEDMISRQVELRLVIMCWRVNVWSCWRKRSRWKNSPANTRFLTENPICAQYVGELQHQSNPNPRSYFSVRGLAHSSRSSPLPHKHINPPEVVTVRQLAVQLLDTVTRRQSIVWPPERGRYQETGSSGERERERDH